MHCTEVSDFHLVPSHPVCPSRPIAVKAPIPSPDPCTVTDDDPVAAVLLRLVVLSMPQSMDNAMLTDPACPPAVNTAVFVPRAPKFAMHRAEVSDSHFVPSHPVCPPLTKAVSDARPNPDPCTVTDADPVPTRLLRDTADKPWISNEHPSVLLPLRSPIVTTAEALPRALCPPVMHRIDVSAIQLVPSQSV